MHRLAALLAIGAAAFAGCGSENSRMIPEDHAQALLATIDEIDALVADAECAEAAGRVAAARAQVDELPRRVSRSLKRNLREWLAQIDQRLPRDCRPEETPTPEPTPEETETPSPTATPEETETPIPTETPEETATAEPTITVEPGETGGVDGDGF